MRNRNIWMLDMRNCKPFVIVKSLIYCAWLSGVCMWEGERKSEGRKEGLDVCMLGKGSKTGHDGNQKWAFCLAWYHMWHICIALHESSLTDSKITLHLHPFVISAKRSPATLHLLLRHHGACMSMNYKLWFPLNKWLDINTCITVWANSRDYTIVTTHRQETRGKW